MAFLEIWSMGHSKSLKMVQFNRLYMYTTSCHLPL